jgi:diguanylate cyclase (GGDEF)-like protein
VFPPRNVSIHSLTGAPQREESRLEPTHSLALWLAIALGGVVAGWFLASLLSDDRRPLEEAQALRDRERVEAERAIARIRRQLEEAETREHEHATLFQILPEVVNQMFAAKGRREVLPLALKLVDQTFRPSQAAIFVVRPAERRLVLAVGHDLPASLRPGRELDYGQSRVGYVAASRLAMDDADFRGATALVRRQLEATAIREFRADVVAPIEGDGNLVAVVCVGGIQLRQAHAKRLLKMVADLTGVALVHVQRLKNSQEAADVDGLTGLLNKRALERRITEEVARAERQDANLSLLLLDIDHFKNYNDTSGHPEGDAVLKAVGQILRSSVREDDVAARYGGEEFVVVYPGATKTQALALAENLRVAVESHTFTHGGRQPAGRVTLSGGVATYPEDSRSSRDLVQCADQALYAAKDAGRNRIVAARPNYLT